MENCRLHITATSIILLLTAGMCDLARASTDASLPAWGGYNVYLHVQDGWQKVGRLAYREHLTTKTLSLARFVDNPNQPLQVRLEQTDGGEGHIDAVQINGHIPLKVTMADQPMGALQKVAALDHDLLLATRRTVDLTFPAVRDPVLSLAARVEFMEIARKPFRFPGKQGYLTYHWDENHQTRKIDGQLTEPEGKPFLRKWSVPQSGHPAADTWAWVSNDTDNLYVAVDFLPDNTPDPGKDYAALLVRTSEGERRYEISARQGLRWGQGAFTYTAQALYQHKAYEFKIPRTELPQNGSVHLALETYGTASQGHYSPAVAWDSKRNRYMVLYTYMDLNGSAYLQTYLAAADGVSSGTSVTHDSAYSVWTPFAADIVYNRIGDEFLAVYKHGTDSYIYGIRLPADNSKIGSRFVIGNNPSRGQGDPEVAYDAASNRYLVVWAENRGFSKIWGQLVNVDGTLYASSSTQNILLGAGAGGNSEFMPTIANDSVNGRFTIAWDDSRGSLYAVQVFPDGSTSGVEEVVSSLPFGGSKKKGLAFDPLRQQYLAVFWDNRNTGGTGLDVFGQFLDSNVATIGTTAAANFALGVSSNSQLSPVVSYNATLDQYLAVWSDWRLGSAVSHGQIVEGTGTFSGTNFPIMVTQPNDNPALAANDGCGNWLMVAEIQYIGMGLVTDVVGPPCTPVALTYADNSGAATDKQLDLSAAVGQSANGTIQLFNSGGWPVQILSILTSGEYSVQSDGCTGFYLFSGNGCAFQVKYAPSGVGSTKAPVVVQTDNPLMSTLTFVLSGSVIKPDVKLLAADGSSFAGILDLGITRQGVARMVPIVIKNNGSTAAMIDSLRVSGTPDIAIQGRCTGQLIPGEICDMGIVLDGQAGKHTGTVEVRDNTNQLLASQPVNGVILATTLTMTPATLALSAAVSAVTTSAPISIANRGKTAVRIDLMQWLNAAASLSVTDDTCLGARLNAGGSCTFAVRFAPSVTGPVTAVVEAVADDPLLASALLAVTASATQNRAPSAPQLVAPPNGSKGVPLTVALAYLPVTDPDGEALAYQLYLCERKDFSDCEPRELITSLHSAAAFAMLPWAFGFVGLIGFRRRRYLALVLPLLFVFAGCQAEEYIPPFIPKQARSQQVSGLQPDTDYYWKVVVSDGSHRVDSEVWTFHTVAN